MEEDDDGGGVLVGGGDVSMGCADGDGVEVVEVGGGGSWEEEPSAG